MRPRRPSGSTHDEAPRGRCRGVCSVLLLVRGQPNRHSATWLPGLATMEKRALGIEDFRFERTVSCDVASTLTRACLASALRGSFLDELQMLLASSKWERRLSAPGAAGAAQLRERRATLSHRKCGSRRGGGAVRDIGTIGARPIRARAGGTRSGASAWRTVVPSLLGARHARTGLRCGSLELLPPVRRHGLTAVIDSVVVAELPLPLLRHQPENADVGVGHDRAAGPGNAIETAVA